MAEQCVRNEPDASTEDDPAPQKERAAADIAPARRASRPILQDDEDASLSQSAAVFAYDGNVIWMNTGCGQTTVQ